jgi:hypothetical protein
MAENYKEIDFEKHIEAYLLALEYNSCVPEDYDKDLCQLPAETLAETPFPCHSEKHSDGESLLGD